MADRIILRLGPDRLVLREPIRIIAGARGLAGKSAYQAAVEAGFEGTLQEWLTATDALGEAEADRRTAETARATAETGRSTAEGLRVTAEQGRATAEGQRVANETDRIAFAQALDVAADGWALAESGRASAESTRVSNETARGTAESARATAESGRVAAETGRANAEAARVTAESGRQSSTAAAIAATLALPIRVISGTTGTIDASDAGKVVETTNAGAVTLTISNALPADFVCDVRQAGSGRVTLTMQAGGTLRQADSLTTSRKQWSTVNLHCRANAGGSAAEVVASGDLSS